ncbi:uncharacterized protein LOC126661786 [Mercurialis annua]|uniref:uncharacterized protein LOC126661786 n=1 Tax=Mercurialis annua TaxID=3986 RepID=UPI00215E9FB3|nr:uncharacterized protein LOC126661786 [Mercurialis annua]
MNNTFNCISWNCRGGLSFSRKQRIVRSMVTRNNLSILGLIETKQESFDDFSIRRLWPNLDFDYCFTSSIGASGGLVCIWNKGLIIPFNISKGSRWICLDFLWRSSHIGFILIYASNCSSERALFWNEISSLFIDDICCLLLGDFNEVLMPSERLNCSRFTTSMHQFSEFIFGSNLLECPLQDRFFTWQKSISKLKLDRCFLSGNFATIWPNYFFSALPRSISDHVPLLFRSEVIIDWGLKPFKSINAWWDHPDFSSFVSDSWTEIGTKIRSGCIVLKLRELRVLIKAWNHSFFGNLNSKLDDVHQSIHRLEATADFVELSDVDRSSLSSLHSESFIISKQLESLWHQKSRMNWNLYDYQAASLTAGFSEEEICLTVMGSDDNKAPGPDGFNYFFYKKAWKAMKSDIIGLFENFHRTSYFPPGINTAFLVLIPKVKEANNISDFRPINLINGRNTHDCHMIATEVIHLAAKRRDSIVLLKLDFKKAFDSISWDFILKMLSRLNFDDTWIMWMSSFFKSSQLSVLVNGSPTKNF